MSEQKHTQEPLGKLLISKSGHKLFDICIVEPDGGSVCHFTRWDNAPEKAQRIVQCVNEFAGVKTVEGFMEKMKDNLEILMTRNLPEFHTPLSHNNNRVLLQKCLDLLSKTKETKPS